MDRLEGKNHPLSRPDLCCKFQSILDRAKVEVDSLHTDLKEKIGCNNSNSAWLDEVSENAKKHLEEALRFVWD